MPPGPRPVSRNGYTPGPRPDPKRQARLLTPFARWLKANRLRRTYQGQQITQAMLADLLDMSFSTIFKLENGQMNPQLNDLQKFADFFRVDVDELYLKTYNLPPDMHLFLCTTIQGEQCMKNIRKIMDRIDAAGGATRKPDVPPEARIGHRTDNGHVHERTHHFSALDVARYERTLGADDADEPIPIRPAARR